MKSARRAVVVWAVLLVPYLFDVSRAADRFTARLRDEVDIETVRGDLAGVVHETLRPTHASVWLRGTGR